MTAIGDEFGLRDAVTSVLVVSSNSAARTRIVVLLAAAHFDVTACASAVEALALLRIARRHAMVVDAELGQGGSVDLLRACMAAGVAPTSIMTAPHGAIESAVEAFRAGYSDYVPEPFDARLAQALRSALAETKRN